MVLGKVQITQDMERMSGCAVWRKCFIAHAQLWRVVGGAIILGSEQQYGSVGVRALSSLLSTLRTISCLTISSARTDDCPSTCQPPSPSTLGCFAWCSSSFCVLLTTPPNVFSLLRSFYTKISLLKILTEDMYRTVKHTTGTRFFRHFYENYESMTISLSFYECGSLLNSQDCKLPWSWIFNTDWFRFQSNSELTVTSFLLERKSAVAKWNYPKWKKISANNWFSTKKWIQPNEINQRINEKIQMILKTVCERIWNFLIGCE